jgi:hypothetical protein
VQPILPAIEEIAAHREACSRSWSSISRTARARTSGENLFAVFAFCQETGYPKIGLGMALWTIYSNSKLIDLVTGMWRFLPPGEYRNCGACSHSRRR